MGGQNMPQQMVMQQLTPEQQQAFLLQQQQRRQEIGDAIYNVILQKYGEHASKITGMLLDNDKIVDQARLV
jgi:hypothetical protein